MAKERSQEESGAVAESAQPGAQVKIRWDDTNMRSVYANVCNVAGTREEIVILFGMNQAWNAAQREIAVQLADRIVLSPFVAKRLCLLLDNVIRDYESKWGTLDLGPSRPA
jgi:hypothetical protein